MATRTYGITFPLLDDTETNRLLRLDKTAAQTVKSQLTFLLLTTKGERWYNPEFGTLLRRYFFEPNDRITWSDVLADIEQQVSRYIPNVTVAKVDSSQEGHSVKLVIHYVYSERTYQESDLLTITFAASS
jgi:phage baseplate assembly protein W